MKLTAKDLRRAARGARELAMEAVNGNAPSFDCGSYDGCAAHAVAVRAGLSGQEAFDAAVAIAAYQTYDAEDYYAQKAERGTRYDNLISEATHVQEHEGVTGAIVFPLLSLADALDLAAQPPSSAIPDKEKGP